MPGSGLATRSSTGRLSERAAVTRGTHADAFNRIDSWKAAARQRRREARRPNADSSKPSSSPPSLAGLIRAPQAGALAMVSLSEVSRTPLEDHRKKHGLDKVREALFEKLAALCSLDRGLAQLNRWTDSKLQRPCESVAHARIIFPNVTLIEICMFGLLEKAPSTMRLSLWHRL